jgi:hypothetical protein
MLDFDLAELYEVENRALKQAGKRNIDRFPNDFMFILNEKEVVLALLHLPSKVFRCLQAYCGVKRRFK